MERAKAEAADTRTWNIRKKCLTNYPTSTDIVSSDNAQRWVPYAAEDSSAKNAGAIILFVGEYMKNISAPRKYEREMRRHAKLQKAFGSHELFKELLLPLVDEVAWRSHSGRENR